MAYGYTADQRVTVGVRASTPFQLLAHPRPDVSISFSYTRAMSRW